MWGVWILMLACISLGASQDRNTTEYVDYDYSNGHYVDAVAQQTHSRVDAVAQQTHSRPRPSPTLSEHKPRRPVAGKKTKPRGTTPVPIITDIRRVDPHTGAFYYHYEGGDGSMKHEVRFPNGTVLGNFTYVKENGELETNTYHHGLGTNIIENDNGSYDLHRHLEEAYVHQSGPDPVEELFPEDGHLQPNSVREQSHSRPSVAQPRPVSRDRVRVESRPRPIAQQPVPSAFNDHQAQASPYHPTIDFDEYADDYPQSRPSVAQPRPVSRNKVRVESRPRPIAQQPVPSAFNDHQAQASPYHPTIDFDEYADDYPQSQDQHLVPVPVSGQKRFQKIQITR